mgnify:CR=1 FL=1
MVGLDHKNKDIIHLKWRHHSHCCASRTAVTPYPFIYWSLFFHFGIFFCIDYMLLCIDFHCHDFNSLSFIVEKTKVTFGWVLELWFECRIIFWICEFLNYDLKRENLFSYEFWKEFWNKKSCLVMNFQNLIKKLIFHNQTYNSKLY